MSLDRCKVIAEEIKQKNLKEDPANRQIRELRKEIKETKQIDDKINKKNSQLNRPNYPSYQSYPSYNVNSNNVKQSHTCKADSFRSLDSTRHTVCCCSVCGKNLPEKRLIIHDAE